MDIIYGKQLNEKDRAIVTSIANECGILFDTARLLFYRNINTVEKAKAFLSAGKSGFNDPYLFNEMSEAVRRIIKAKDNNESVLIFGDYDADGICATTILYYSLKEFGITADFFVPERDEGYGLSFERIETLNKNKKIDLIITVDCGISSKEVIEEIKNLGIDDITDLYCNLLKISTRIYPSEESKKIMQTAKRTIEQK